MSDMIEDYKALKISASNERRLRRELAQRVLEADADIAFSSHNQGAHLILVGKAASADFWPGTGLWHARGPHVVTNKHRHPFKGHGLEQVLEYVKTGVFGE
ncbi:hypothetical protein RZS08_12800 [Arthrospira platensis SPKY1]|nr:hypothetical protein [Arthrospira platensis SPKY1]